MQPDFTTKQNASQAVPIRRADGRTVGEVSGGVFRKTVCASKHFLRMPPAIGFDLDTLATARERGAKFVEVFDCESGRTYRASIARIWQKGFAVNRGHGEQIALALSEWNRDAEEPTADQLPLFGA